MAPGRLPQSLVFALALSALAAVARGQDAPDPDLRMATEATGPTDGAELRLEPAAEDEPAQKPPPVARRASKRKPADLPPLRPYAGAQRAGLRGGGEPNLGPTVAANAPPPAPRKAAPDPAPFDPVGIRVGDFDLKPYAEQQLGYASNPLGSSSAPKASGVETTEAGLAWQSEPGRNDFHGALRGGYSDYFETPEASGGYGAGTADLRLDASRDLAFQGETRFAILPQPLSNFGVATTPGTNPFIETATFGATLGAAQTLGRFSVALSAVYDRQSYQNIALGDANLAEDDYNDWGLRLKTAYRVSAAVSPYVEIDADARRYDNGLDALGYQANSEGLSALAGVDLGFSQMVNGALAVGYGARDYQDQRLAPARAPLIDASLIWTATPLTTVTLKAATALEDAIVANASADIHRNYTIDVTHALTRRLTLDFGGGYATDGFVGSVQSDRTWSIAAKAEYHFSRYLLFRLSATQAAYQSNLPGQNSTNTTVLAGIRLQR